MTQYKIMTVKDIPVPEKAAKADIWVTANIFSDWTSGSAQFDDFSVTADLGRPWNKKLLEVGGDGILVLFGGWLIWKFFRRGRSRALATAEK